MVLVFEGVTFGVLPLRSFAFTDCFLHIVIGYLSLWNLPARRPHLLFRAFAVPDFPKLYSAANNTVLIEVLITVNGPRQQVARVTIHSSGLYISRAFPRRSEQVRWLMAGTERDALSTMFA
jgi:hypothetical protein